MISTVHLSCDPINIVIGQSTKGKHTQVSQYQKGKTNLDFNKARDSEWQWHQLGHMQVCTSLQTDNHASTPPLSFFTGRMPFLPPNQQRQSTEGKMMAIRQKLLQLNLLKIHIPIAWVRPPVVPKDEFPLTYSGNFLWSQQILKRNLHDGNDESREVEERWRQKRRRHLSWLIYSLSLTTTRIWLASCYSSLKRRTVLSVLFTCQFATCCNGTFNTKESD